MNERIEKIKTHLYVHRGAYISGGLGIIVGAGITCIIMRGRHAGVLSVPDGPAKVTVRSLNFLPYRSDIVNVIEREGRGHPGYLVQCLETGEIFTTQGKMARAYNISPSMLSSYLNNKIDNVNGLHFERLGTMPQEKHPL